MNNKETRDTDFVLTEDIPLTDDTEWHEFAVEEIGSYDLNNEQEDWIATCY